MGVLSEGWPSLVEKYRRIGLDRFFDLMLVSAETGFLKTDPELFAEAGARFGLSPAQVLYADDWLPHVEMAVACGFQGVVVARREPPDATTVPWVKDLSGVEQLVS